MNNAGVKVGFNRPKLTLSMRMFEPCNSSPRILAYVFFVWISHRQTDTDTIYIYISRKILIEQPSVGLASLTQLRLSPPSLCLAPSDQPCIRFHTTETEIKTSIY